MSAFAWFVSLVSLVALVFNLQKRAMCFVLWTFTNSAWAWLDFEKGLVAQAALQLVYLAMSIYGFWRWGIREGRGGDVAPRSV